MAFNPFNIDVTPGGRHVVVSNANARSINADAEVTIEATGVHPHVVSITASGTNPEGFAIAPNGKWAVAPLLEETDAKPTEWNHTKGGHAALMSIGANGMLTVLDKGPLGALPEGEPTPMPDAVTLARLEGDMMGKVLAHWPPIRRTGWRVRWRAWGGRSWRATREFSRTARDAEKHSPT